MEKKYSWSYLLLAILYTSVCKSVEGGFTDVNKIEETRETNNETLRPSSSNIFCSPFASLQCSTVDSVSGKPELDVLDQFLKTKTGCEHYTLHRQAPLYNSVLFGAGGLPQFSWRGAVRAAPDTGLSLRPTWHLSQARDDVYGIFFMIGEYTSMLEWPSWNTLERRHTPGLLSADRYVPFYYRVQAGILTFGVECSLEPLFTRRNITLALDHGVVSNFLVDVGNNSPTGAQVLHRCPAQ